MADITMPQLGETVTEGTITKWFKSVGDEVSEDEPLFEVSTDKVDSEVPSPASGYVSEILVQEGETVDVGAKLAVISTEAPSGNGSGAAPAAPAAAEPEHAEPAADDSAMQQEEQKQAGTPEPAMQQEPAPEAKEPEPEPRRPPAATRPPDSRPSARPSDGGGSSKVLSPVVRRLIAEHDLN